ncbi:MAG TPA: calcium-binding protein [Azospirillum sp.]|nr:calcium-binding protein [Azospirillum sp.]
MVFIRGRNSADSLSGAQGNDDIHGMDGADELIGFGGSDRILGGAGDDTIYDDFTDPFMEPPSPGGNDLIYGQAGNDFIRMSHGNDTGCGGAGDDVVRDDSETDDVLRGGAGNDRLIDFTGNDVYLPGPGNDYMVDGQLIRTGADDGADRYLFESTPGGFGADTILGFDKGFGDRIEFVGYQPGDLLSVSETERASVFTFSDGSQLTAFQDERQVLHGLTPGVDYFFV